MKNVIITLCTALLVAVPATIGLIGNTSFSQSVPVRPPPNATFLDDSNEPVTAPSPSTPTTTAPSTSDDKGGERSSKPAEPKDSHGGRRGSGSPQHIDDQGGQSGKTDVSGESELSGNGSSESDVRDNLIGRSSPDSPDSLSSPSSTSSESSPSAPPRTADDNVATPARTGDDKMSDSGSGTIAGNTESGKNGSSSSTSDGKLDGGTGSP